MPAIVTDIWEKYKLLIIGAVVVLLLLLIVPNVISAIITARANKTPIVKIKATNDKTYKKNEKISEDDFDVTAIHEDGKETSVKTSDIKISRKNISVIGETTMVVVSMKENEDISCEVKVKNSRKKIREFACGFPDENAVKAVLYSNGELAFQGEGGVREYSEYPWLDYEEDNDYPITSVTFEKRVTPQYMDRWFKGLETLTYVDPIPSSVESMIGTFEDCSALKKGVDWSACAKLIDISGIYADCEALVKVPAIPKSVKVAAKMCHGCVSLSECPDLKQALQLEDMTEAFAGCSSMTTAYVPDKVYTMEGAFKECINLSEMPKIPLGVFNMNSAFEDCSALRTLTNIPGTVTYADSCFAGCSRVDGRITIDATLSSYSNIFNGVASATSLDVRGNGLNLNEIVFESENPNITVNGKPPVDPETLEEQGTTDGIQNNTQEGTQEQTQEQPQQ